MCKVRDIESCEKKMIILLNEGEVVETQWFLDLERKNTYGDDIFTTAEEAQIKSICSIDDVFSWNILRNKNEDDCVYISRHAFDRMRERNGWNKKTALRMVKKVYDNGLSPEEYDGEYKSWVMLRSKKHPGCTLKMYGNTMYVFDNNVLVTAMLAKKVNFAA